MLRTTSTLLALILCCTASDASADAIHIESGTYGANCGAYQGNATHELAQRCDSVETCRYPVALPADFHKPRACRADFVAEWSCGRGEFHRAEVSAAVNNEGILVLTCVPSTGAGK
ncbi:hypothetical protein [Caballeronia sp. ATUFL_M2_KS44]|uniref:hypothetical protein n=1 Tax=Caballeronia sp. ATUFL_M2_KS44 TaxID=2921767 RepID=UPI0020291D2B|nr:hypothetical protein [Caballeronia sp. ATUFL_M2_KS44]